MYKAEVGNYPDKLEDLIPEYLPNVPFDACGIDYLYIYPGKENKDYFDLWSLRCNGRHDGVSNWR